MNTVLVHICEFGNVDLKAPNAFSNYQSSDAPPPTLHVGNTEWRQQITLANLKTRWVSFLVLFLGLTATPETMTVQALQRCVSLL